MKCAGDDKFVAYITYLGITNLVGRFDTREEAARAYDQFLLRLYGEQAATSPRASHLVAYETPARFGMGVGRRERTADRANGTPALMSLPDAVDHPPSSPNKQSAIRFYLSGDSGEAAAWGAHASAERELANTHRRSRSDSQLKLLSVSGVSRQSALADRSQISITEKRSRHSTGNFVGSGTTTVRGRATSPRRPTKSSCYRGVSWNKKDKRWQAMIFANGKATWLGYFKEEEAAARAYDAAAWRERGDKAKLNFPPVFSSLT